MSVRINDFVVKFANVNGTGSASANTMFATCMFKMGIPFTAKNIFPSNIQGLPTWYEVRVNDKGYKGRKEGVDVMICLNPQSMKQDVASVKPGGYFIYDSSKFLNKSYIREDITYIGIPMTEMSNKHFEDPRYRQLLKNMIYVGALSALLNIERQVITDIIKNEFKKKEKLIAPNELAVQLGIDYVHEHFQFPIDVRVERRDKLGNSIFVNGNTACGLGAVYAGATVASWYPITPSTSLVNAFEKWANRLRIDKETGAKNFAIVQAEDELAAIGMAMGACWNGARGFTATSGPGLSLMSEFLGLAYFSEIPVVLIDVQRGGPSTGMPTRTQQSDLLSAAYASHGDTKHVLLIPSNPKECFDFTAKAFDLTERLQTPVIVMTDLDLGMNDHLSAPFEWDDAQQYDRGKVLSAEQLEAYKDWGRYKDDDGDGIPYRTIPGTHPTLGSYFTRGSSHDKYARYSEDSNDYIEGMERLERKWDTAKTLVYKPEFYQTKNTSDIGLIFFGTTTDSALEAVDILAENGVKTDSMRLKSFPFQPEVQQFIEQHKTIFIIEQNRDAQMKKLLVNELETDPKRLKSVLHYDGTPVTADFIVQHIIKATELQKQKVAQEVLN